MEPVFVSHLILMRGLYSQSQVIPGCVAKDGAIGAEHDAHGGIVKGHSAPNLKKPIDSWKLGIDKVNVFLYHKRIGKRFPNLVSERTPACL